MNPPYTLYSPKQAMWVASILATAMRTLGTLSLARRIRFGRKSRHQSGSGSACSATSLPHRKAYDCRCDHVEAYANRTFSCSLIASTYFWSPSQPSCRTSWHTWKENATLNPHDEILLDTFCYHSLLSQSMKESPREKHLPQCNKCV